tara:strand:+ start:6599 stop:6814 length:216 start_codon:yes stop_codon:yes gene_type:complete
MIVSCDRRKPSPFQQRGKPSGLRWRHGRRINDKLAQEGAGLAGLALAQVEDGESSPAMISERRHHETPPAI